MNQALVGDIIQDLSILKPSLWKKWSVFFFLVEWLWDLCGVEKGSGFGYKYDELWQELSSSYEGDVLFMLLSLCTWSCAGLMPFCHERKSHLCYVALWDIYCWM